MHANVTPRCFDKGHQLALVVSRAASIHAFNTILVGLANGFEGWRRPELQWISRLHVIVAIEQGMRCFRRGVWWRVVCDNNRAARRFAHRGIAAQGFEFSANPVRGFDDMRFVGGVSRERGNAQKVEQPFDVGIEMSVGVSQDGGDGVGHVIASWVQIKKSNTPVILANAGMTGRGWRFPQ